jgi:hypothetical protein
MERFILERRRPERCALCHGALAASRLMACALCGSVLHDDCRAELTRCPTLACDGALCALDLPEATFAAAPRRVTGPWPFLLQVAWPALVPHLWIGVAMLARALRGDASLLPLAVAWDSLILAALYLHWWPPLRDRLLVKHGRAVRGTVADVRSVTGKTTTHRARFRFVDPRTGRQVEGEMRIRDEERPVALACHRDRTVVTVLFDPGRPTRAVAYELCPYRVVEEAA